ncbi:MAG: hypothetical protein IJX53_05830 [Clostridia bacterium]|nr:hypothetical protein [Clostridia bacterium]
MTKLKMLSNQPFLRARCACLPFFVRQAADRARYFVNLPMPDEHIAEIPPKCRPNAQNA